MKMYFRCLLGITLVALLTGCAAGTKFARAIDGIATVRATPNGVQTEIHPRVAQIVDSYRTQPEFRQQYPPNLGNGWYNVSGSFESTTLLTIPYGQGGACYWLTTHGNVVEAWYEYNGNRRDIDRGSWKFWIDNSGDGGDHELIVAWRYAGQLRPRSWSFLVRNNSIQ